MTVFVFEKIEVSSRYDFPHEVGAMCAILAKMPGELREQIISVFCDSKASATYSIALHRTANSRMASRIGQEFTLAAIQLCGGHNGVYLSHPGTGFPDQHADPIWTGDQPDHDGGTFAGLQADP